MSGKNESFISKNSGIIIILVLYLFYTIPILVPFSLAINVGEKARTFYELVDGLPDETTVLMVYDYSAVSKPLFQGIEEGFMKHIFDKNGHIIMVSFSNQGPMMYRSTLKTFSAVLDTKTYGEDYVFLGFIPGSETGLTSFLSNIRNTISEDFMGYSLDSLPIMDNINSAPDFDLVFDIETGTTLGDGFVRQVSAGYGVPLAIAASGGGTYEPYYPDQLQGLPYPLPQAGAEYEQLLGAPGNSSAQMSLLLLGNLFYIVILLAGNISELVKKRVIV